MGKAKDNSKPLIRLKAELNNIMQQVNSLGNEALNEASDLVKSRLESATPIQTGRTRADWINVNKYNLVKYVFNESVNEKGIPIVNLLEFGSKGNPFAIATFRACFSEIEETIIKKLNQAK